MSILVFMQIACKRAGRKPGSKTRFHHIMADAKELNISPSHLWLVLDGQRQSKRLLARYNALQEKKCMEENKTKTEGARPAGQSSAGVLQTNVTADSLTDYSIPSTALQKVNS